MKYKAVRGTKDILPDKISLWRYIEETIHETFQSFGFDEIRTPIFEQTELFTRSIGDQTDIVSKEMYTFNDKKGRSLTLRPEATAGVVRAAIENSLLISERETKLYYLGPMFRYERPQAGRLRQFHQAGIEFFGNGTHQSDVNVILTSISLFEKIGIKNIEINLNSVGCPKCRPAYVGALSQYMEKKSNALCEDCKRRLVHNPLRVLDCKEKGCGKIAASAPVLAENVCGPCKSHFDDVFKIVKGFAKKVVQSDKLVRGLDYYTSTVFEIISNDLGSQNALCGGGRYDGLVKELGGKETPAVGMSLGIERLISVVEAQKIGPKYFIASIGDKARERASAFARKFRTRSWVEMGTMGSSLKSQLKTANNVGAKYALIIGDDEITSDKYILRNMQSGEEKEISPDEISKLAAEIAL